MSKRVILGVLSLGCVLVLLNCSTSPANPTPSVEEKPGRVFKGYDCTVDCSGHEAGYKWAEQHDIDSEDDCETAGDHSNSPSFAEGCKAFVNGESSQSSEDDHED